MDHNFFTGNPKFDKIMLCFAWITAIISWDTVPIILSCIASLSIIVNQYYTYKNRKKKNNVGEN